MRAILALFLVLLLAGCVTAGQVADDYSDQVLVCPEEYPFEDVVVFIPLDGGVVLNRADGTSVRAVKVQKGMFSDGTELMKWSDFVDMVKQMEEGQEEVE